MISGAMEQSVATDMTVGRLYLYSGHDTTVRPLLQALAIPEYRFKMKESLLGWSGNRFEKVVNIVIPSVFFPISGGPVWDHVLYLNYGSSRINIL